MSAGGKILAEVKIQRDIFLGDELSPLLFIIVMTPLSYILRKFTWSYKFTISQETINYFM